MAVRVRVVADPSIGVSDLEQVLTTFLDEHDVGGKKANLFEYLRPPTGCHWKSSPNPGYLARISKLLMHYCQLAPNGVLPAKKHKQAIQAVDCQRSLNQTKKSPEDFSDMLDDWVRMSLSHCRSLRSCETAKARCFRRADTAQVAALEEVLNLLTGVEEVTASTGSGSPGHGVLVAAATPTSSPPSRHPSTTDLDAEIAGPSIDPAAIFQKVLAKCDVDEEGLVEAKLASPAKKAEAKISATSASSPPPKSKGLFLHALLGGSTFDPAEQELLVELDEKSVQTEKPAPKPKKKAKAKAQPAKSQGTGCKGCKDATKPQNATKKSKATAGEDATKPKNETKKSKARAGEDATDLKNEAKKSKRAGEDATDLKNEAEAGEDEGDSLRKKAVGEKPAGAGRKRNFADHEIDLTTLRKRLTSRAYHKAYNLAIKEGKDDAEGKKCAKLASAKASAEFEKDYKSKKA